MSARYTKSKTTSQSHGAMAFATSNPMPTLPHSSYARVVLERVQQLMEGSATQKRAAMDVALSEVFINSACPGQQYLLVTADDQYSLLLCGMNDAEEALDASVARTRVKPSFHHLKVQTDHVSAAAVDRVRAAGLVSIDWDLALHTEPARGKGVHPLHIVRRQGYPVASGVMALNRPTGGASSSLVVGGLSIAAALPALDQVRCWFLLTSAAASELGRRPRATDQLVVNEKPAVAWLSGLTTGAGATMASWAALSPQLS